MRESGLIKKIEAIYKRNSDGILCAGTSGTGYWSNLDESENSKFLKELSASSSAKEAVKKHYPLFFDVIYSPKREAGLELLNLKGDEKCVDYGCMWGALTVPLAKRTQSVLGVDQTLHSLSLLSRRIKDEKLSNIDLLCENLNDMPTLENEFDVAIVNGVLEWVPEIGKIELKQYFGKQSKKYYARDPKSIQVSFLKKVFSNLNRKGKLYLAIENRYDLNMFFGFKDPHSNLPFTSILPRGIANKISMKKLGRPYVNWIYSFPALKGILGKVGFDKVDLYNCFPNYRFPDYINLYGEKLESYSSKFSIKDANGKIKVKRMGAKFIESILFRYLKNDFFAPSIIAVAHKK